ncbi:hypothetical protein [Flavobacterium sp. U410]
MSGFILTIIVCEKKISKQSNFFSDLNFNKEKIFCTSSNSEFSINEKLTIKGKDVYIYDDFFIEYNDQIKNYGYSDFFWKEVLSNVINPKCSLNISSMSRDYGSFNVILKHLEQLFLENYHFYLITNNIDLDLVKQFSGSTDLIKINEDYYIISEKVINYFVLNDFFDFIEY